MCRALQKSSPCPPEAQLEKALHALSCMRTSAPASTYIFLLQECKQLKALAQAKQVYAHLVNHLTPLPRVLGNHLVLALASCGAIEDAIQASHTLPHRTVVSWTAIIAAYVDSENPDAAFKAYQCMLDDGIEPDRYTFVSLLKACGIIPDPDVGKKLHAEADQRGFLSEVFIGNTLISMYGKCRDMICAEKVFCEMSQRNTVSWNSILTACVDHGQGEKALQIYSLMHAEGLYPNQATCVLALQACTTLAEKNYLIDGQPIMCLTLEIVEALHADLHRRDMTSNIFVASTLICTYGKCRAIGEAQHVFLTMSQHDVVSWNVIFSAYVELGRGNEALQLYVRMQKDGTSPDKCSVIAALQACTVLAEQQEALTRNENPVKFAVPLEIGQSLHADAQNIGVASDAIVQNVLLSMYGKCGATVEAEHVFHGASHSDAVSWNAMLSTYVDGCDGERALHLYSQMQKVDVGPDQLTFVLAIQACTMLAEGDDNLSEGEAAVKVMPLDIGRALYADARRRGLESDPMIISALISMYGKCGAIAEAEHMFRAVVTCDVVAWNALFSVYVRHGEGCLVLQLLTRMQQEGVIQDHLTFMASLQACALLPAMMGPSAEVSSLETLSVEIGKTLHADACKRGFLSHTYVGNTLVNMYGKCGAFLEAEDVFKALCPRTVVSWNAILSAYVEHGLEERALQLYAHMQEEKVVPDQLTCVITLQACALLSEKEISTLVEGRPTKVGSLGTGYTLHDHAVKQGYTSDLVVVNALLDMCGKCGATAAARHIFDRMLKRSVVSWNVMLSAYVEQGQGEEAVELYGEAQKQGMTLDHVTHVCSLQACSMVGSSEMCEKIHFGMVSVGHDDLPSSAASLIQAYGRCASMADADSLFDKLLGPDIMTWNARAAEHAGAGNHAASMHMFEEMKLARVEPNEVTFTSVLSACNHAGLVVQSFGYFESMASHGLAPDFKHYGSMIDLLGRAGDFKRLQNMLKSMPMEADSAAWMSLLGACYLHGNVDLARHAFGHAVRVQPEHSTLYVLMSNIYANNCL